MITGIDFDVLSWKILENDTFYPFIEAETEYVPIKFYGLLNTTDSYFSIHAVHAIRSNKIGVTPELMLFAIFQQRFHLKTPPNKVTPSDLFQCCGHMYKAMVEEFRNRVINTELQGKETSITKPIYDLIYPKLVNILNFPN
ncbi:MAG: hypothetical protein KBF42_05510 [Chitinophagales bacterium]|jgi:hypothetical protein|nr:hypothetical protein [Bacteroidota bacterium]MBK7566524.1 hypothetical protein [Bacteroidota bacterium]MBP8915842.1 hypothetical protein [Chitinophagales bacterium]MBP9220818.1 hypothetical protein [Chitinophagales bacterium]MBP9794573.1 hypothetical protein [Chitinophagales bacterium]